MIDDRLIDDVARELTATEPQAALRARVMSALDAERPSVPWRRVAALAGAAAMLAVGINAYVGRVTSQPVPAQAAAPVVTAPARPAIVHSELPAQPSDTPAATVLARRVRNPPRQAGAPTAEQLAWQARAVPPLAAPDALALGASQPVATIAPLLDVTPLATEPLEVAPLDEIDPVAVGGA